jgi:hypothetical protein
MGKIEDILEKIKKITRNKKFIFFILSAIFLAGIFLRAYQHENWLVFQLDQARDIRIVSEALDDFENLPLLGPRAGGTGAGQSLHLGPVFYYFQYIAGFLFGPSVNVMAWPDLTFSVLLIPLFYYFSRKYFSIWISVFLTLISSLSLFLISYGRFAWNPNSIPFFILLMLIGLINGVNQKNKKIRWFLLAGFSMAILMQLHFVTFFIAPIVFIVFLAMNYKSLDFKIILIIIFSFLVINLPIFISEYQNKGENTKGLFREIFSRTGASSDESEIGEKIFESVQKISFYNWITISSNQNLDTADLKNEKGKISIKCSDKCSKYLINSLLAVILFLTTFGLLVLNWRKEKKIERKNFLLLNIILITTTILILTPIIKNEYPRFFLVESISALVLLGILIDSIGKFFNKKSKNKKILGMVIVFILMIILIYENISNISNYFKERNALSNLEFIPNKPRDLISQGGEKVTLSQIRQIVEYIENDSKKRGFDSIVFAADNYYAKSIAFVFERESEISVTKFYKLSNFDPPFIYDNVYYIKRTDSDSPLDQEITEKYQTIFSKEMGSLVVYKLSAK